MAEQLNGTKLEKIPISFQLGERVIDGAIVRPLTFKGFADCITEAHGMNQQLAFETRLRRVRLIAVRFAILRVIFLADFVLAMSHSLTFEFVNRSACADGGSDLTCPLGAAGTSRLRPGNGPGTRGIRSLGMCIATANRRVNGVGR